MPKELFGTDGIRGVPGTYPLDDRTLYWVGRTLGEYLRRTNPNPRALIGMDTRESGPHIAGKIAAGLTRAGVAPASAGVISTPGVAFLARRKGFSAGVVISASHNPFHDNGVKLFSGSGMKFPDEVEESLEREILQRKDLEVAAAQVSLQADASLDEAYLAFLRSRMLAGAKLAGMKLVLDCANGAATQLGPELFRALGADVVAIHNQPDGRNINAGCGSLHPESLQRKVVETRAALGVAFDGDADRGLERALAAEGLGLARVPVGDRYVLEEMRRSGANLGGEQSGHIIFLDDATTGDGLLTALKIACLVALRGPLDELVAGLKIFPQTKVSSALAQANRSLGDSGRIVLRYSGTEPLARVMVEAERAEDVERWSETIAFAIQSSIGI